MVMVCESCHLNAVHDEHKVTVSYNVGHLLYREFVHMHEDTRKSC